MFPDNRIQSITMRCDMNIFMNSTTTQRVFVMLHATSVCWLTINLYQNFCIGALEHSYPPNCVNIVIVHYSCKNWFPLSNKYSDAWVALANTKSMTSTYRKLRLPKPLHIFQQFHIVWSSLNKVHVDELYQLAWFLRFFRNNSISFQKTLPAIVTFLQIDTHAFLNF
jgi:hypothetical protein